jgi:hypothetical protein
VPLRWHRSRLTLPNVDPASVYTLEALAPKHRAHLIHEHREHYSARATVRAKLEVLAERLGPIGIMRYTNLYLDHNPRLCVWYLTGEAEMPIATLYNGLTRKYGAAVRTGLRPQLEEDGPAELHRMIDRQSTMFLEFGVRDRIRAVFHNWEEKRYRQDSIYRVVVSSPPLMLEVRATGIDTQQKLVVAAGEALGRNFANIIRCDLKLQPRYDGLQAKLGARFRGVVHAATGEGLSRSSLEADEVTPLNTTADYITQSAHLYRTESSRRYEFFYQHADGYSEKVRYEISLLSGDIRLNYQISEKAVEAIRSKVAELFNGP